MALNYLIGRKMGMTRIFNESGVDFPVTIVEAGPCSVAQLKTEKVDGYYAVQLGYDDESKKNSNKAKNGHFKKAGSQVKKYLGEFSVNNIEDVSLGQRVSVEIFNIGDIIAVSGKSKGKGFAGHMKRHGFSGGRRSHGKNSVMRKAGAVSSGTDPARVWPGSRMAGRMGNENVTVKNLEIVRVETEKNLIFIKGAVPGGKNGILYLAKL